MPRMWLRGMALALLLCGAAPAAPDVVVKPGIGVVTKLPIPRFVSLRSDQVNFRAGPGFQYPVTWTYERDGLPVEIIGEFDVWRQVLAPDGGTGWVHEATIRARRGFYVTATQVTLRRSPDPQSAMVAYLDQGVSGVLLACAPGSDFCRVATAHESGYLARTDFWGTLPGEAVK